MAWENIIGQKRVKGVLKRLAETGKLPHALMFYGPEGAGQDAAAIELAKVLNCTTGGTQACDECDSCRQFNALRHPRLKLVFPLPVKQGEESALEKMTPQELADINEQIRLKAENLYHTITIPKANIIKISSIRDIVREGALRSSDRGRTVVVVFQAEKMNLNAANALLKSLEEPTGNMMFILCTSNREAMLPTIRSRCQQFRFEPLSADEIIAGLKAEGAYNADQIHIAAQLASGSYSTARQLVAEETMFDRESVRNYLRTVMKRNPVELVSTLSDLTKNSEKQQVVYFLILVQFWFRDIIAIREGQPNGVYNTDMIDSMQNFAEHYPDTDCNLAINMIDNTIEMINKNVHLMNALVVLSTNLAHAVNRKDWIVNA